MIEENNKHIFEKLMTCVGKTLYIYCKDGGSDPSSGMLVYVSGGAEGLVILENENKKFISKSYINLREITRFTVHYPK